MNILDESLSGAELQLLKAIAPADVKVDKLNQSPSNIYAQSFLDSLWSAFDKSKQALKSLSFKQAAALGRAELANSLKNRPYYC